MAKIILIDDDEDLREMLKEALEESGHEVRVAADGVEGCRIYRKKPAELVITDLMMPEMDGLETILSLRKEFGSIPIIAISGGGRSVSPQPILRTANHLGATRVLTKPFSIDELLTSVQDTLASTKKK